MNPQVVLVHGAWHGAWAWSRVLPLLSAAGIEATAPDLPGHGDDGAQLGDLHSDAAQLRSRLDLLGRDVILVGHSYGGAVITEAGVHPAVRHLVFVAALALDRDETCFAAAADEPEMARISHKGRPDLGAGMIKGPRGTVTLDSSVAATCLFNDCDEETRSWAVERLGAHRLISLQQSPRFVAWRNKPSSYVVCSEDLTVHPHLQRVLAKRCSSSTEWPTGHSPFLSRPDLVAEFIRRIAEQAARS